MPDANFAFFKADQLELPARNNFCVRHQASHALEKIANVAPGLESQQIELEQRAQESLLLWQLCKNVVRRKRDVQEKRPARKVLGHTSLAQSLGDVHQVIVMHPDEIIGFRAANDG